MHFDGSMKSHQPCAHDRNIWAVMSSLVHVGTFISAEEAADLEPHSLKLMMQPFAKEPPLSAGIHDLRRGKSHLIELLRAGMVDIALCHDAAKIAAVLTLRCTTAPTRPSNCCCAALLTGTMPRCLQSCLQLKSRALLARQASGRRVWCETKEPSPSSL